MTVIVGLGNPGSKYRNTRHNIGFMVLDALAERLDASFDREKFRGLVAEGLYRDRKCLLLKPLTYMNLSGDSVARAARNRVDEPGDILVVVDDVNLPFGRLRLRPGGSAGGHNGLKSIIERLGTQDFARLRLGVDDAEGTDLAQHVLGKFRPEENEALPEVVETAVDAIQCWLCDGIEEAMNKFNRP